ncbi:MAG: hypothetical protein E6Q88_09325 [Lysobacteraceae bacterium]|nr:MAG: hypothetical protein E6Q88_09325 [Xanthomonadaceae bacterium]
MFWLFGALALIAAAGWLWYQGRERAERARDAATETAHRLQSLESRAEGLRRDVSGHGQRLQQADATNRVLRDELLGIGQRAALLEDNVAKLADANRRGAQAMRLDEAELLLTLGQQRLILAADLDGARRAYALAAGVLDGIDSPGLLNLRQTLAQERAALDALQADPRHVAQARLDAFARALPSADALPAAAVAAQDAPWWERVLTQLVRIQPADRSIALSGNDRDAAHAALQLELTLARAAIERRDETAYRSALARAEYWLLRLWPDSPQRQALQSRLKILDKTPLALDLPTLGSSLTQLRSQRGG